MAPVMILGIAVGLCFAAAAAMLHARDEINPVLWIAPIATALFVAVGLVMARL